MALSSKAQYVVAALVLVLACDSGKCVGAARTVLGKKTCGKSKSYVPRTREYWIAAVEEAWDYTPLGRNVITGEKFDDDAKVFTKVSSGTIGSKYKKAMFVEYTRDFAKRLDRSEDGAQRHMGFLGPAIRAVVGDKIIVHFRNMGSMEYSIHAHGVRYTKAHEGAPYDDGVPLEVDDAVPPGKNYTYEWEAAKRSGPGPRGVSTQLWGYHSHIDVPADINSGMVGPIVIVDPAFVTNEDQAAAATPCDVDREFFLYFSVTDENANRLFDANLDGLKHGDVGELVESDDFVESNLMHGINGYMYGNGPLMVMKKGDRVRWHLMAFGTEVDMHVVHWHGNTVDTLDGRRTDTVHLFPATFDSVDMRPDSVGTWMFVCHTHDHLSAGMLGLYKVI